MVEPTREQLVEQIVTLRKAVKRACEIIPELRRSADECEFCEGPRHFEVEFTEGQKALKATQ